MFDSLHGIEGMAVRQIDGDSAAAIEPCCTAAETQAQVAQAGLTALFVAPDMDEESIAVAQAHRMLEFVAMSRRLFPAMRELADHPGWEIMLHVFLAGRQDRAITAADLSEITGCWRPLTLRYVELLYERGLLDREIGDGKAEACRLRMTDEAEPRFLELLCGFARGWTAPGMAAERD